MRYLLMLAGLLPLVSHAELSDLDAAAAARHMRATVTAAEVAMMSAISAGDKSRYGQIKRVVMKEVNAWPEDNLKNAAAFPYSACRQAALDLIGYGDSWERNDTGWRQYITKRYKVSEADCAKAIASPDLSLKNIR